MNTTLIKTAALDMLSWIVIFALLTGLQAYVGARSSSLALPDSVADLSDAQVVQFADAFQALYYEFIAAMILFSLVGYAVWALSRAWIWHLVIGKKLTKPSFRRLLRPAGILLLTLALLILILFTLTESARPAAGVLLFLLFGYLAFLAFLQHSREKRISAVWKRWDLPLGYLIVFLLLVLLTQALNTLGVAAGIGALVAFFLLLGWSRMLLFERVKRGG